MALASSHSNKRIAKNTLMLYFRMLVTLIVALYASRVILQVLGASDYGLYNVVAGFVTFFTFVNNTLATGTQRFLTYSIGLNDEVKLKEVFATALTLHLSLAIVFVLALETIGLWFLNNKLSIPDGRESAAFWVFQFATVSTMATIIQVPFNAVLASREKFNIYAYMSIYDAVMKLLIVFLIQIGNFDKLILYSALFSIVSLSSTVIYNIYCRKHFEECSISIRKYLNKSLCKEIGCFSGWNIMGCTAVVASNQGVNMLLNMFLGTLVNAARGISVQVSGVVGLLANNFLVAVNPQIVKLYAQKSYEEMFSLAMNASKFGAALMLGLCIPLVVEMNYVLTLWLKHFPDHTIVFSICALVQAIVMATSRPLITILHATGKMKLPSIVSGSVLLLIMPITYFMLKMQIDVDIVVCINVFPWICELCFSLYFVNKFTGVNTLLYVPEVVLKIALAIAVSLSSALIVRAQMSESFIRLICVTVSSSFCLLVCVYCVFLNKATRAEIIPFIKDRVMKKFF